jgi:hypothetical protein
MIIILDASILDHVSASSDFIIDCLENIAIARAEGNHLVSADPVVAHEILKFQFSKRAERVFNIIRTRAVQELEGCLESVHYIRVVGIGYFGPPRRNERFVDILTFRNVSVISPTSLLCEDSLDGKVISELVTHYMAAVEGLSPRIKYKFEHGGGERVVREFSVKDGAKDSFLVCVIDSDKKFLKDSFRGKARKLQEARDRCSHTTYLEILPCHEVENLIPVAHLEKMFSEDYPEMYGFVSALNRNDFLRYVINYLDLKKGVSSHLSAKNIAEKRFWENVVSKLGYDLDKASCITGFGDLVVSEYEKFLSGKPNFDSSSFRPVFQDLARKMVAWGQGCPPVMAG